MSTCENKKCVPSTQTFARRYGVHCLETVKNLCTGEGKHFIGLRKTRILTIYGITQMVECSLMHELSHINKYPKLI